VALITLLTDFGLADTYVAQVKGAILTITPSATLIDLTHAIPPQEIQAGAFLLWSAVEAFPPGSVHLAVVDPGVGSARRGVALSARRGDLFVGPDNGLLMPAVERLGGVHSAVSLTRPAFWRLAQPSHSFHGRDIFGPVAAHLASGTPLDDLGERASDLVRLSLPEPQGLSGEVIHVDTYGNLVTNFRAESLPGAFEVALGGYRIPLAGHYAEVAPGALLTLVGSAGLLEISARNASAADITEASRGAQVTLHPLL
jgi:S-adenosylmethionine hydrolase